MDETPKVYGDRICRACHGVCHEDSWRTRIRVRHMYFCSEAHLRRWVRPVHDAAWPGYRDRYFVRVVVVAR